MNEAATEAAIEHERPARILIVDDERKNRKLLEVMLTAEGFELLSATTGEEALVVMEREPPDLVLLDVMMPGMDGYQLAREIKSNAATKHIPIVMVTALDDRNARILGLRAGAEDFLTKPIDRAELCVRVKNLLRLKAHGDFHDKQSQILEAQVDSRTAELIESERLYRSTFDGAPVGIVHVGLDGRWLRVNQRACDLLGYSSMELQSHAVQTLVQSEDSADHVEPLSQMMQGVRDRYVIEEMRYRRRDGNQLWTRIHLSVHRDADGAPQHFISVFEDITERRALETQLRQASKMEAFGLLASGVAHDFNNLLSIVLCYSELVADELAENDPKRADLNEIKNAGRRAADLTRQLLAFSRQQVLQPKIVDLAQIAVGMQQMLNRLIGEDVELTVGGAAELGKIQVDPGQMEQIIMNLVVNARDSMPNGGKVVVETSNVVLDDAHALMHPGTDAGPHVMLEVRDDGAGMTMATQARVFEPFFTTKEAGKGTGLGLATVFGIVRQSGGSITIQSAPDAGTSFKIYFPTTESSVATERVSFVDLANCRGTETILLVEDDERFRVLTRTILRKYGYNVLEAQSGGDALLLCEQTTDPIDLLLTDVVMPRMNGRQLAARLLSVLPSMKVLYMSGHTDDAVLRQGVEHSMLSFMQKPITPHTLACKVRATLDAKR